MSSSNLQIMFVIVVAFVLIMFIISQRKFKNKMLCEFIRPNKQKIEAWVPMHSKYVTFDQGKYGIGQYIINPKAIITYWYARGINKFFPCLVPTLIFRWDTPFPLILKHLNLLYLVLKHWKLLGKNIVILHLQKLMRWPLE